MKATILKTPPPSYINKFSGNYDDNSVPENKLAVSEAINPEDYTSAVWNGSEWTEGATPEDVQAIENAKVVEYRAKIFSTFESLLKSAKERAVGKVGENLTERQLDDLELIYNQKNDNALKIIAGEPVSHIVLDTLNFEIEFDFNNQFDLATYCAIINGMHTQGSIAFEKFKALAENVRTRLLTDLSNKDFQRIDNRYLVVGQITQEMSMEDLENLTTIFNETE